MEGKTHEHEAEMEIRTGVITVSTSRYKKYGKVRGLEMLDEIDDPSGKEVAERLKFQVEGYALVPDDKGEILKALEEILPRVDAVIITGGTGLNPFDVTVEAIEPLFEKKIEGFGEIFRYLSFKEIGTPAILSRATAGVIGGKIVFCLPGSKRAVSLAVNLINDFLKHLISHSRGIK
jgi:molybdenum cofactor biosynthesis protein B